jgi:hypothetical protein
VLEAMESTEMSLKAGYKTKPGLQKGPTVYLSMFLVGAEMALLLVSPVVLTNHL